MGIIADVLEHMELEPAQLLSYTDEYESAQPYDCMIDTARALVAFLAQEYGQAEKWILSALRKNPIAHQNHLYHALISQALGQYAISAVECYATIRLSEHMKAIIDWEDIVKKIDDVLSEVVPKLSPKELQETIVQRNILFSPELLFPAYYLLDQKKMSVFQGFLYSDSQKQYNDFVCIEAQSYIDSINQSFQRMLVQSGAYALSPVESWKAQRVTEFKVKEAGQVFAVATTAPSQVISIKPVQGESMRIQLNSPYTYHYINMDEAGTLQSAQEFILSKPIPSAERAGKKKLIMFVNVNSLSQWYLAQTDFASMPFTRTFFGKGTIFRNCYSTSESSYPSGCSLLTGLYATRHHIICRSNICRLPAELQTASEIFNQEGYFTVLVSRSLGCSPYVGSLRGFDCAKCKAFTGYEDSRLVEDALCFMEGFPNTNRYILLELFAPHTAIEPEFDGSFNYNMPRQTTVGFRSLYDPYYSSGVEDKYQAALRETDRELKKLYDYVLSHYKEEEYVVCLCSEHGASAMGEKSDFLKKPRTNTVLMFRGGGIPAGISEEYINHIDYLPILSKLAGIDADFSQHDCVLPRTFGGPGRDYVYTESIYQGQTYKAAVRTAEFECRFETNANTDIDGLIDLSQGYTQKVLSMKTGEEVHDPELAEDFEGIVFDHIKENIKY